MPQPTQSFKIFSENIVHDYRYLLAGQVSYLMIHDTKDMLENVPSLTCYVTDVGIEEMVRDIKHWISQE